MQTQTGLCHKSSFLEPELLFLLARSSLPPLLPNPVRLLLNVDATTSVSQAFLIDVQTAV